MPMRAKRLPNKPYRPKCGAAASNGTTAVLNTDAPISIALPMLPIAGDESKVEQTL
ncbi:hypothetical protein D3C86_1062510 [compost metagenome]